MIAYLYKDSLYDITKLKALLSKEFDIMDLGAPKDPWKRSLVVDSNEIIYEDC